jgi:predicted dehydrogenase
MTEKKRCLMLGGGGMARNWLRRFFPKFVDRLEVAALVDVNREVLDDAGDFLGLPADRRFTSMAPAFETVDADFCIVVIPPAFHEEAVMRAVRRGLPILSEKPIADTWDACQRIYAAVKQAGLKMQVIQNYRYNPAILAMRQVLRGGTLGRLNYVVGRYAQDYREYGSWGSPFRHEIPHSLLVEGAVHHFDMLRNLSGADCARLTGWEWNPPWSTSKGEFCNLYLMEMTSGARACYEGSGTAAGEQNSWHGEYYRAECEGGAIAIGLDPAAVSVRGRPQRVVRIHRHTRGQGVATEDVPALTPAYEGHEWMIDEFLNWLAGGPTPATSLDDNIQSVAMVFAAIEASATNQVVDVQAMVRGLVQDASPFQAAASSEAPRDA